MWATEESVSVAEQTTKQQPVICVCASARRTSKQEVQQEKTGKCKVNSIHSSAQNTIGILLGRGIGSEAEGLLNYTDKLNV